MAKINGDMVRADLTKILHLINPEKVAEKILLKMTKVREDFSAYAIRLVAKDIYAVEDIVARYCKFYLENEYQGTSVGFNHALAVMKKRVSKHLGEFEQLYQDVYGEGYPCVNWWIPFTMPMWKLKWTNILIQ